jgi:hypothetical protein
MKRVSPEPGSVAVFRCGRGISYPESKEGWINIAAWSHGASPWKQLSPFLIGPIEGCSNFESWWQSHKVWESIDGQKHVGDDGLPNEAWYAWRKALLAKPEAVRRPNGYAKPLYAWHGGQKLGVVEARKQLYIPELQRLYRAHPVYQQLLKTVTEGQSVIIIEPDGPAEDVRCQPLSKETLIALQDCTTCKEAAHHFGQPEGAGSNRYFPYGHGYVIALTLLEDLAK